MATPRNTIMVKKIIDADQLIALYMNWVLTNEREPKSVYAFAQANEMEEADFYVHFGSFDGLKQMIWVKFFHNATTILAADASYATYTSKNKLLTLYFTLFEVLTLNRSYILYSLKDNNEGLKNLKALRQFRSHFKSFVVAIIESDHMTNVGKLEKVTKPVFSEGAWIQFLLILKFWLDDGSAGFEKTDIVIEKSVNTVVDLLDTKPLENLIDLGKFLWKERML